jgi:hypothetical protein
LEGTGVGVSSGTTGCLEKKLGIFIPFAADGGVVGDVESVDRER